MSASTKNILLVAVAVALAAVAVSSSPYGSYYYQPYGRAAAPNKSHNLIIGMRQPGDQLVYRENIIKSSKWLQVVSVTKKFNATRDTTYNYVITQVRALDQKTNGNGAIAQRISGGPGYSNITLKFNSQRSHGINFVVELYAKRRY